MFDRFGSENSSHVILLRVKGRVTISGCFEIVGKDVWGCKNGYFSKTLRITKAWTEGVLYPRLW